MIKMLLIWDQSHPNHLRRGYADVVLEKYHQYDKTELLRAFSLIKILWFVVPVNSDVSLAIIRRTMNLNWRQTLIAAVKTTSSRETPCYYYNCFVKQLEGIFHGYTRVINPRGLFVEHKKTFANHELAVRASPVFSLCKACETFVRCIA